MAKLAKRPRVDGLFGLGHGETEICPSNGIGNSEFVKIDKSGGRVLK